MVPVHYAQGRAGPLDAALAIRNGRRRPEGPRSPSDGNKVATSVNERAKMKMNDNRKPIELNSPEHEAAMRHYHSYQDWVGKNITDLELAGIRDEAFLFSDDVLWPISMGPI
jgi:hypothetical protein